MRTNVLTNKLLVLGVDGMDPRLTRKYVDKGIMPNLKKIIDAGACREDLVLLGAQPTVTPPQWTTLATGSYPMTHGITGFFRQSKEDLDYMEYNLDSRLCSAEQVWNGIAEAGYKTMVWHWPGSAWPPSSDNPNLSVVDGTSPGSVGMGTSTIEMEFILRADEKFTELTLIPKAAASASAPCVIDDVPIEDRAERKGLESANALRLQTIVMSVDEGQEGYIGSPFDVVKSPIKMADDRWANAPTNSKEFTLLLGNGTIRRFGLILQNQEGIYDSVEIYTTKKDPQPLVHLELDEMIGQIIDDGMKSDKKYTCNRNYELLQLNEDGSSLTLYISSAIDINNDDVWHPKELYQRVTKNCGYPTPTSQLGGQDETLINNVMLKNWTITADWQAHCLNYLIEQENYEVIFSHFHAIDLQEHIFIRFMTETGYNELPPEKYQKFMEDIYIQTDNYIGQFLHLLDDDWSIFVLSDHAQVAPKHRPPMICDMSGVNVRVMEELGYTYLKRDQNGVELREIDWERTKAIANRECNIYLNIKGRDKHGIVEPEDQYEVEEQLMTDLYGYKDPKTGKRVIALALRNKDAAIFGYGGPECGDIVYFTAEGYNFDHSDFLSTTLGEADTSVSPIFIAAGAGIKKGFTKHVIRQVDIAPTAAIMLGARFPAQCEGAPIYPILDAPNGEIMMKIR